MKRLFALVITFALLFAACTARAETTPEPPEHDELIGAVLCAYKLLTVTVTDAEARTHGVSDDVEIVLRVEIVNDNNFAYECYIDDAYVNTWQADHTGWFRLKGGRKAKEEFVIRPEDDEIRSLDDIETLSISFRLLYANYEIVTDEVTLTLKQPQ